MNSYKQEIPVADVVANDGNPRRDFGDVEALAATFLASGGQPLTPIIVVPDGARWRLVDGERRYRAMLSLGTERCDALVFPTMQDAEVAVAMMATDDSKALTEGERLRGFQTMMALGVDDEVAANVVGTDAATVRRMRRIAADAPEQATLDGLIAAADDEFSEGERADILAEASRRFGDPQAAADRIRKAHERERRMAAIRTALPDGVELRPGGMPWNPERDGLYYVRTVRDAKAAARLAAQLDGEADVVAYEDGVGYAVYRTAGEGAADPEEAERARVRRVRDEHAEDCEAAWAEMLEWALEPYLGRRTAARGHLEEAVMAARGLDSWGVFGDLLGEPATEACAAERPSLREMCQWLRRSWSPYGLYGYSGDKVQEYEARRFARAFDACVADGWRPSPDSRAVRAMCPEGGDES